MNLLLLHLFARDAAARMVGRRIDAASWYPPVLSLALGGKQREYLVAVMESPGPFVFLAAEKPFEGARAPSRFGPLVGAVISGVSQSAGDRILRIDARPPDHAAASAMTLELHLYGALASALLRREDAVIESIGRRHRGARNAESTRASLVDIAPDALGAALTDIPEDESPQSRVPGVDRALLAAFAGDDQAVTSELARFRDGLVSGGHPFALSWTRKPGDAVPVPTSAPQPQLPGPFDDVVAACEAVGSAVVTEAHHRMIESLSRPLRRRLAANRKLVRNLQGDIDKANGHDALRREAENLAAFQAQIPTGADAITLDDIYTPGEKVTIELNPAEPVHVQIEKRFRKATKLEKSLTHASRRLELVEQESTELTAVLQLLAETPSLRQGLMRLEAARARFGIDTPAPTGSGTRNSKEQEKTLRRVALDSNWFVIVGRNNQENDEVTFRHGAPKELWFHAQGVPGSHVILKSHAGTAGNPPAAIIERAARVAAHYSRAKHSGLVPVIYTERRYVRKFRGAKPGQVTCEREKMVMVEPVLP